MFSALTKATLILLHYLVFICVLFDSYGIIDCLLIFARGARKTQEANKLVASHGFRFNFPFINFTLNAVCCIVVVIMPPCENVKYRNNSSVEVLLVVVSAAADVWCGTQRGAGSGKSADWTVCRHVVVITISLFCRVSLSRMSAASRHPAACGLLQSNNR